MIKDLAWKIFKSTGNVDTYLELKQIENIQKNINERKNENEINNMNGIINNNNVSINEMEKMKNFQKVETNGNSKNERNNNS